MFVLPFLEHHSEHFSTCQYVYLSFGKKKR
jgi:hypothetical protein